MLKATLQFSSCIALAALCAWAYIPVMRMAEAGASNLIVVPSTLVLAALFVFFGTGAVFAWEPKQ